MYKLYCRIYQTVLKLVSAILPWRRPELIEGRNSMTMLSKLIKNNGIQSVLVVTDQQIVSLGLANGLL